jgi:hypothetical protein
MLIEPDSYKPPSINSRTGAAIWSKCNFGPTDHSALEVVPFALPRICTVPNVCAIFECTLEVMSFDDVQHRLQICLIHLKCPNGVLSVLSSIRKTQESRPGETTTMLFYYRNYLVKKGRERVRCRDATASFGRQISGRNLHTFSGSCRKTTVVCNRMANRWLNLPGQILCEQSPRCQRR